MPFYKDTKSFKIITIVERMMIENKILNLLLVYAKVIPFSTMNYIKIKMKKKNKDKIQLFFQLYKEYFYLWIVHNKLGLEAFDSLSYCVINNHSLIVDTTIADLVYVHMEIDLYNDTWVGNIKYNNTQFNITEKSLENDNIRDLFNLLLSRLNTTIDLYLTDIILYYEKRCTDVQF